MLPAQRRARKGGGALRATTKAGVAGNRLATIGAEFPFRPCEQARGRKGNSRQPFGFPGPPDTKPRLRRDTKTTASRSARNGAVPHHFNTKSAAGALPCRIWERWESGGRRGEARSGQRKEISRSFPSAEGGFPIWCAEAKPPSGECRRVKLASTRRLPGRGLATRGGAPASQIRRGSATPLCFV